MYSGFIMNVADQLVTIPEANLHRVEEAFKKLTTRAKRTKLAAPVYIEVSRETRLVKASELGLKGGKKFPRVYVTLQVAGNRPHIPGYTFLGAVNHGEKMNVLSAAPDQEIPERFRTAKPLCDHCRTKRQRKDTFILRHEDSGAVLQIARNCLQDYLGEAVNVKDIVAQFTSWRAAMDAIEDSEGWGGFCDGESRGNTEDIAHYLAVVATMVRKFGWVSRGQSGAGHVSTASEAWRIMYPARVDLAKIEKCCPDEQDIETAANALEWIRALPESELTGYIGNVAAACQSDTFRTKHDGLVASLVGAAYPKAMGFEQARKERAEKPASQYLGTVKERLNGLELKVIRMSYQESRYSEGYTTFCIFEDASGNNVIWSASKDLEGDFSEGDTIIVDGTVKNHNVRVHEKFGSVKQTWLTRCKIVEVKKIEAA